MKKHLKKFSAICQKLLPGILTLFLLSFIWTKSWSLICGLFYGAMGVCLFTLDRAFFRSMQRQWPCWLFLGWFTLSSLWSPSVIADDLTDTLRYSLCIGFLLMIFSTSARDRISWRWLAVAATIPTIYSIFLFYHSHPIHTRLEHLGTKYPVSSAGLYAFYGVVALWMTLSTKSRLMRIANGTALLILGTALLLTQSRGPALGFLMGCAAITCVFFFRRLRPQLHQGAIVLILFILSAPQPQLMAETVPPPAPANMTQATQSFMTRGTTYRTNIWKSTLDQMPGHWLIGHGLNAPYNWLQTDYARYGIPYSIPHLHSLLFSALFHGGLIGLGLLLLLAGTATWRALRHAIKTGNALPLALLAFGLFCSIFGGSHPICRPRGEWIIFWIPICYALTCWEAKKNPEAL
jgi:hypothetical protein